MAERVYLRPTGFVDAPFGLDGKVERLAGGLLWFAAVEVIVMDGGTRLSSDLVPVERMEGLLSGLPDKARRAWMNLTAPRPPRSWRAPRGPRLPHLHKRRRPRSCRESR
jgi:dihydropteroate synthase